MRRRAPALAVVLAVVLLAACRQAAEADGEVDVDRQQAFVERYSNIALRGGATDSAKAGVQMDDPDKPSPYRIVGWQQRGPGALTALAVFGAGPLSMPVPVPVQLDWAGEVPVLRLSEVRIPGIGTYSATWFFHGDRFAGTWQGTGHGGHFFGDILRPAAAP